MKKQTPPNLPKRNHTVVVPNFFGEGKNLEAWQLGWQPENRMETKSSVSKKIFNTYVQIGHFNMIFYYVEVIFMVSMQKTVPCRFSDSKKRKIDTLSIKSRTKTPTTMKMEKSSIWYLATRVSGIPLELMASLLKKYCRTPTSSTSVDGNQNQTNDSDTCSEVPLSLVYSKSLLYFILLAK